MTHRNASPLKGGRMSLPHACIIGAGTSGLICAKVLKQHGIPFDCFEKSSSIGGI